MCVSLRRPFVLISRAIQVHTLYTYTQSKTRAIISWFITKNVFMLESWERKTFSWSITINNISDNISHLLKHSPAATKLLCLHWNNIQCLSSWQIYDNGKKRFSGSPGYEGEWKTASSFICISYTLTQIHIHTWASFREIPAVCLSWRNEFRLMKEEEKLTLEGLSLYYWRSRRKGEETRSGENSGRPGERETEIALRHSSNIYHGSNTWFTASPRISPTLNKPPQQLPRKDTDRPKPVSVCCVEEFDRQAYRQKWVKGGKKEWQRLTTVQTSWLIERSDK